MKTKVFIKKAPFMFENKTIFCDERKKEIEMCKSEKTKKEKENIWLFLQEIAQRYQKSSISGIKFIKQNTGKWTCDLFDFSLSHSEDYLAIAISDKAVGVDVQKIKPIDSIKTLILNESESKESIDDLELIKIFSKKEAMFKTLNEKFFVPKKILVDNFKGQCLVIDDYVLSIYTEDEVEIVE